MSEMLDRSFDRVLWRDGDRLAAADLQSEADRDQVLRSLHVGLLHGTWGIALGLDVREVVTLSGATRQIAIGAGYAIDQKGRDLILPKGMVLDIPTTPQPTIFVLCAAAVATEALSTTANSAVQGLDARIERAAFVWRTVRDAPFADEVPLTALRAQNGLLAAPLDSTVRRPAQRAARPYIASGMTDLGATDWKLRDSQSESAVEMLVRVDTADAGFSMLPVYTGRVLISKVRAQAQTTTMFGITSGAVDPMPAAEDVIAVELGYIVETDRTFFEYRVPIDSLSMFEAARQGWAVGWEGIEPLPDCGPAWSGLSFFTRAGAQVSNLRFATLASGVHL
jgi:hypothetical protein